jgi:hypothetical protein
MSPFGTSDAEQIPLISTSNARPSSSSTASVEQVTRNVACGFFTIVFSIIAIVALFEFSFVVPPGEVRTIY